MIEPKTVSEQLMFSTLAIRTDRGSGSGFIYQEDISDGTHIPMLITNKHVIEGCSQISLTFHLSDSGKPSDRKYTIVSQQPVHVGHFDAGVDLCAVLLAPYFDALLSLELQPFYLSLREDNLATDEQVNELSAIESVTMIGYPNGLADTFNNLPIMRGG